MEQNLFLTLMIVKWKYPDSRYEGQPEDSCFMKNNLVVNCDIVC